MENTYLRDIITSFIQKEIIKFGDFTLKSGKKSDIYFDLRTLISYPELMNEIVDILYQKCKDYNFDCICGVAYTGIPIATGMSLKYNIPMIMKRKERKEYGTGKMIEGSFKEGTKCLLIDDVITSGSSLKENMEELEKEGIRVENILVFIDRRDNPDIMKEYKIDYIFTLEEIRNHLKSKRQQLEEIMLKKRSNLCLSLDVTQEEKFFNILERVASSICLLKIHIDIIELKSVADFIKKLSEMRDKYGFMILEDRKFADIGTTVKKQFHSGIYKISQWTDFITVHGIMGKGTIDALSVPYEGCIGNNLPEIFLLAEASSEGNLIDKEYTNSIMDIANTRRTGVAGFIAQHLNCPPPFLRLTPGVHLKQKGDNLGQTYRTPEEVIKGEMDIMIVGRGIYESNDMEKTAKEYQMRGWMNRLLCEQKSHAPHEASCTRRNLQYSDKLSGRSNLLCERSEPRA